MSLPDAPWIQDAERYGVPDVTCPICERSCGSIYIGGDGDVCGCDKCMRVRDAYDWLQDEMEAMRA